MGWDFETTMLAQEATPSEVGTSESEMASTWWFWVALALGFVAVIAWVMRHWYVGGKTGPPWFRH